MSKLGLQVTSALARKISSLILVATVMVAGPSLASTWTETGDAGQTQASAQVTAGGTMSGVALTDIFGSLGTSPDADLYQIEIVNPSAFSATTVNAIGGFLDTQLFLFTLSGAPVYMNDDADGTTFLSTLPAGSSLGPILPGIYLLGISLAGYDPVNVNNQLLFAPGLSTDVRGPASLLQPALLGGFADNTFFPDSGRYDIQLTGVVTVPEPTSGLLVVLACALCVFTVYNSRRRTAMPAGAA
jgi:hypothetical protein